MSTAINTIKLLRFPFSVFLLPVTLFSFYFIQPDFNFETILLIAIWHLFVFPSSNGYNSYHDRDTGPIGGLANPPKPSRRLLIVCNTFDTTAILLSLIISVQFAVFVFVYVAASRLYSNRSVRLKKFPILGFVIVFILQGLWVFFANILALTTIELWSDSKVVFAALATSCFIGTIYPLTQIYQHDMDRKDGVMTLSMLLGIKGTFLFSAAFFAFADFCMYMVFQDNLNLFVLFNLIMLPSTLFFLFWAIRSYTNISYVNFKYTMIMLILSSILNNLYFFILLNHK